MTSWRAFAAVVLVLSASPARAQDPIAYKLLATSKTSTMQKEMNEAAEQGFRFSAAMGGETFAGGSEVVVAMARQGPPRGRYSYRLLATSKTSTMQKEMQQAADGGFRYRAQTVFNTAFGGREVVVILERDDDELALLEYKLLATSKTGTMQKELTDAGAIGFELVGVTVGSTALGGNEVVAITQRMKRD